MMEVLLYASSMVCALAALLLAKNPRLTIAMGLMIVSWQCYELANR